MPKPAKFDLDLYRGDSDGWGFIFWTDDLKSIPLDLTGVTPHAQIRDAVDAPIALDLTCTVTMPNIIDVSFPSTLWVGFSAKKGVWDLELSWPGETPVRIRTVVAGAVAITSDVTVVMP